MRYFKFFSLFSALLLFISERSNAQAPSKSDSLLLKTKHKLYHALSSLDSISIEPVKNKLERLIYLTDKKWLVRYYLAHANKMLADREMGSQDKEAKKKAEYYLDEAEALLKKSIKEKNDFSDSYALLGGIYNQKIALNLFKAAVLSKASYDNFEKAIDIDKENPRTYLLKGISKFFTPAFFGGGKDAALEQLRIAEKKFQVEANKKTRLPILPTWGYDEVYIWLARVAKREGNKKQARAYCNKALEINPNNNWVKWVLLPSLDK